MSKNTHPHPHTGPTDLPGPLKQSVTALEQGIADSSEMFDSRHLAVGQSPGLQMASRLVNVASGWHHVVVIAGGT